MLYRFKMKRDIGRKSRFYAAILYITIPWRNGCESLRAVFFTTDSDPWPVSGLK